MPRSAMPRPASKKSCITRPTTIIVRKKYAKRCYWYYYHYNYKPSQDLTGPNLLSVFFFGIIKIIIPFVDDFENTA